MKTHIFLFLLLLVLASTCVAKEPSSSGGLRQWVKDSAKSIMPGSKEYSENDRLRAELQQKERENRSLRMALQKERDINRQNQMAIQALRDIAYRLGVKPAPNTTILGLRSDIFIVLDKYSVPPTPMSPQDFQNLEIRNSNVPHFLKYIRQYHEFIRSLEGNRIIILPTN